MCSGKRCEAVRIAHCPLKTYAARMRRPALLVLSLLASVPALVLVGGCAPAHTLESVDPMARIEDAMKPEDPNAPLPEPVVMQADAFPLSPLFIGGTAEPLPDDDWGNSYGYGLGYGYGGYGYGVGGWGLGGLGVRGGSFGGRGAFTGHSFGGSHGFGGGGFHGGGGGHGGGHR